MRSILIKEVMTPISEYATIAEDQILFDAFQILEQESASSGRTHRDLIVLGEDGQLKGKVTMLDIFRALEPKYKKLYKNYNDGTLTKDNVLKAIRDFDLWLAPVKDLCQRGSHIRISDVMHIPEPWEHIQEDESLEKALHEYVMGVHQPLIVKRNDRVTGILRFEDLYEVVKKHMLACRV